MKRPVAARGFTLIELMVVVAVIALLAGIGYPSYQEHVARSRRAEAKAALLENAQWMERQYSISRSYLVDGSGGDITDDRLPRRASPATGAAAYQVRLATGRTATSFELQAVPQGAMADDDCGTLTLTHTGVQGVTGSKPVAGCWNR